MSVGLSLLPVLDGIVSLVAIGSGFAVNYWLFARKPLELWVTVFLATSVLTSATRLLFPFRRILPAQSLPVLSVLVLAVTATVTNSGVSIRAG